MTSILSIIPYELIHHIITFIPLLSRKTVRIVCSLFHSAIDGEDFIEWKKIAYDRNKIPLEALGSDFKIMNHVIGLTKGVTKWIGKGSEIDTVPYPMILEIREKVKMVEGEEVNGTCFWPTLLGETRLYAKIEGSDFVFFEKTVVCGAISVPNKFTGIMLDFCSVFNWDTGSNRGLAYGVMDDVVNFNMDWFPRHYMQVGEQWKGIILTPLAMIVDIFMQVTPSRNPSRRKMHMIVKHEVKKLSDKVVLYPQEVIDSLQVPPLEIQEREVEVKLEGNNKLVMSHRPVENQPGWLDWREMDIECYPDLMVGFVSYYQTGVPSHVVPWVYHDENILLLRRVK